MYALAQVQYDWRQNLTLYAGVQAGLGPRGTEYGGIAIREPAPAIWRPAPGSGSGSRGYF